MSKNNVDNQISGNVNRICENTEIKGSIKAPTDYRIDGTVEGSIVCDGKIIIGEKGFIKGEVFSKNMEVSGKIEGTITIDGLLTLKSSAVVNGDITTGKLVIEVGANFDGNCKMLQKGSSEIPQPK